MNQSPRCSVVIPTYNCLDFLPLAIASVRVQAIEDLEILVVDDGSTDGTGEWLAKEAFLDRRIIPLQADGEGPGFARNLAISHARAPLVAFLDADDLWWPHKLARQLGYHELNQDVGLSFTDYLHVDAERCGGLVSTIGVPPTLTAPTLALKRSPILNLSCLLQMSWDLNRGRFAKGFAKRKWVCERFAICGGLGAVAAPCRHCAGRLQRGDNDDLLDTSKQRNAKSERANRRYENHC